MRRVMILGVLVFGVHCAAPLEPSNLPPDSLTTLSATAGDRQITLTWESVEETHSVSIRRDRDQAPQSLKSGTLICVSCENPAVDSGLVNGHEVIYSAFVIDNRGRVSTPAVVRIRPNDSQAPELSDVKAVAGDNRVEMTWQLKHADDLATFEIRRSASSAPQTLEDGEFVCMSCESPLVDTGLPNLVEQHYTAFLQDRGGNTSQLSWVATPEDTVPPPDVESFAVDADANTLRVTWVKPVDDVAGVILRAQPGSAPESRESGTLVCDPCESPVLLTDQPAGTTLFVTAFTYDEVPLWSKGVSASAEPFNRPDHEVFIGRTPEATENEALGTAVAVDQNISIVGTTEQDRAYVFERYSSGDWAGVAVLMPSSSAEGFGRAVAVEGSLAAIGAPRADNGKGAVIVYRRGSSGLWNQVAQLSSSASQANDELGSAVAISNGRILAGAPKRDLISTDLVPNAGAVVVFEPSGSEAWTETAELSASDFQESDWFGMSLDIDSDYAVIGAQLESGGSGNPVTQAGAVYVFERQSSGQWIEKAILRASDQAPYAYFGAAVSLDSGRVVIGAYQAQANGKQSGAAYVFKQNSSSSWTEEAKLTSEVRSDGDDFGTTVSLLGDRIIVGAPGFDAPSSLNQGAVYVFETTSSQGWTQVDRLLASDGGTGDGFGYAVAQSLDRAIVGAPNEQAGVGVTNAGSAYFYE